MLDMKGSFQRRVEGGKAHWYFVRRVDPTPSGIVQVYWGPDSPEMREFAAAHRKHAESRKPPNERKALVRHYLALGGTPTEKPFFRLLERVRDAGIFEAGAVLVGSHAFRAYAGMLGVQWRPPTHTHDVDFLHAGRHANLAIPNPPGADMHQELTRDNGFEPALLPGGEAGVTYRSTRDKSFTVDFLTTLGRNRKSPVSIPHLNITAQPLPYMEFLLPESVTALVLSASGEALPIKVPAPVRYAVHKLIVASLRPVAERTKANKDLAQASVLMELLDSDEVSEHLEEARARGPKWRTYIDNALAQLAEDA